MVVGRARELGEVEAFVRGAGEGFGALVLEGEAGAGKTTVWRAGVAVARESGVRVLEARPVGDEMRLSFAALGDLLREVVPGADEALPEPQRRALRAALALEEPAGMKRLPLGVAVAGTLAALAVERPVVVAIDDLQWLDAASAGVVGYALRRLEQEPVRLFAVRRLEADGSRAGLRLERETIVPIGPLSLGAVQRLLAAELDLRLPRAALLRLHEASGGNPFFALELARALDRRGGRFDAVGAVPVPSSLSGLLRERLGGLPERTGRVLLPAALLAEPTVELLVAAVGEGAWEELGPALAAGIVKLDGERLVFSHPLLAAAVVESAEPAVRRALHSQLAALLPEGEERARHLAGAARGPDVAAAAALERAGIAARQRGAVDAAAELLERAAALTVEDDERARLTISAAEAYTAAEDAAHADELLRGLLPTLPPGRRRGEVLLGLLQAEIETAALPALATDALAEVGDDPRLRAAILLSLAFWEEVTIGIGTARARAREALEAAEKTEDPALLLRALAYLGHLETLSRGDRWGELLERARGLEAAAGVTSSPWLAPTHWLGVRLMWEDRLDEARALLEPEYSRAAAEGDLASRASLSFHLAQLETRAGSATRAREHAEQGFELSAPSGPEQASATNVYALALVEAVFGDADRARALATQALSVFERLHDRFFTIHTRSALALLELSLGHHAAAAEAIAPVRRLRAETGVEEPGIFPFDADEIEALLGSDRLEEAQTLTDGLLARSREFERPRLLATGLRCRGLVLAAQGRPAEAIAELQRALVEHERLPVPLERARTLLALGAVQRRARRKRDARISLEAATALCEEVGAGRWADLARAELGRIGGRRPAGGELTAAEERVAGLVAEGMTNRQVAAALFLSVNTVETTLRRVYRKLGVRTRAELARRYAVE